MPLDSFVQDTLLDFAATLNPVMRKARNIEMAGDDDAWAVREVGNPALYVRIQIPQNTKSRTLLLVAVQDALAILTPLITERE